MCHPRALVRRLRAVLGGWLIDIGARVVPDQPEREADDDRADRVVRALARARAGARRRRGGGS